jgi:hypothetical protein
MDPGPPAQTPEAKRRKIKRMNAAYGKIWEHTFGG